MKLIDHLANAAASGWVNEMAAADYFKKGYELELLEQADKRQGAAEWVEDGRKAARIILRSRNIHDRTDILKILDEDVHSNKAIATGEGDGPKRD